ncbi:ABC transporter substrate-binding protein [Cohnella sp.]|uniref:ABC transporter substrate-binding protein n=1 Tax=Cohnella sp. TaxID=1883426 RepID=UPI003563C0FF
MYFNFIFSQRSGHRQRISLLMAAALLLIGLTAGCGSRSTNSEAVDSSAAAPSNTPSQVSASDRPQERIVEHDAGTTTITGTPQKIAVLDYRLADSLLALGIVPYAMNTYMGETNLPYIDGNPLAKSIPLGDSTNLEALLETQPELIIGRDEKIYSDLQKIAPTVIIKVPDDWRESFREVAAIVQREKEAELWLANYDQRAVDTRKEISQYVKAGETFMYLRVMPKEIRLHGTTLTLGATLFQDLQLTPVPGLEGIAKFEVISLEKLPDYNPDHIFLEVGAPSVDSDKAALSNLSSISETSLWKDLKAVKNGHVYTMPQWVISDYPHIKSKSLELILEALKN